MKKDTVSKNILRIISHYLVFFLVVAFVTTCCMMLFVSTLSDTLNIKLTDDNLSAAAKITFWNVVLLSLIFTVIDTLRRKLTVERPVKHITEAAEKIIQGDFTVRVKPQSRFGTDDTFNKVIDCFNKMAEELGSVETLRTDFIANVSHELKTPLAVMQNYGTMLSAQNLSEKERIEYAKSVTDACRRLTSLITNILKLNKLENQQIFPDTSEFNLSEQLCECLLQFEDEWERKKINIEVDIQEDISIRSDEELLSLVWNNLFSNAIKFTPMYGTVSVSLRATENHITVTVSDTGCGMSKEVGEHIFEKFYQGDSSHASAGNGLGLALVKRVVDIIRGEIHVKSAVNEGSSFTVIIRRK